MTKEKVKIKIVSVKSDTNSVKTASSTESSGHPLNSIPASTSPRSTSASKNDSVQPPAKSKFLLSKDKDVKVKSATSAEAEYDFDQHLLEEKLTEKNQFLKSIHLAPRTAAEMQATKSPSKIEPKNDQPTDLSKDVKPSTPSVTTSSAPPTKNVPSASTSPTTRTTSPQTHTLINVDRDALRRPENKASKRKSREPVKNVTKLKCPPPTSSGNDSHWPPSAATSSNNGGSRSPLSPASSSLLPPSPHLHNDRDRLSDAMTMQTALKMSEQNKNNLSKFKQQHHHQQKRQSPFKTPMASESSSSSGKDPNKTSESETSIIINNVQRPNQADTPRPTMAFNSNMSPFLLQPKRHQLFHETEIKEIRNDDAMKVKVYGPSMPSYDTQLSKNQHVKHVAGSKRNYSLSNQNEPLHMNAPAFIQDYDKKFKSQSGHSSSGSSPGPIDMKKKLNSTGELEVFTSSSKTNATPKRQSEPSSDSVHTLLHNCNITLPSSLSVTLTYDEMESDRSFNQKKTPVNNSIEIVKLPDESSSSPADQSRYTKAQSNSPSLHSRSENNHSGSASPVAINLVNNKSTTSSHPQNASKQKSSNSPVPGPSNTSSNPASFQAHYLQSLAKHTSMQFSKPKKRIFKPNAMLAPAPLMNRSPPKKKPPFNGPRATMQLSSRIPPRSQTRKLLPPKIDSPLIGIPSAASVSELFSPFDASSLPDRYRHANNSANHQSGGSHLGGGSSIPTSKRPIWTDFATQVQKSAHVSLNEYFLKK